LQQGIDVELFLLDKNKLEILRKDTPNGQNGMEEFEYLPQETNTYYLKIKRLEEAGNSIKGKLKLRIDKLSGKEKRYRKKIINELTVENKKVIQTIDIDHFWEAFDYLEQCKTRNDSVNAFQRLYLDRATNGLLDFIQITNLTAESIVETVSIVPKYYNSVRENTYIAKNSAPIVEEIVDKIKDIYPNFKQHKVCFVMGTLNTGGTVSDDFLLIGTQIAAATNETDLSEIPNKYIRDVLGQSKDVVKRIKEIVAHEYIHTQQPSFSYAEEAVKCQLLRRSINEGSCNFIGELLTGSNADLVGLEYGDKHEEELWQDFKNELCNSSWENWFYNFETVEDKPADLGYYIGYKITEAYYNNAKDKEQAIIDIIEFNDPITFLQKSGYDRQAKYSETKNN
jgi:hypothetical protein